MFWFFAQVISRRAHGDRETKLADRTLLVNQECSPAYDRDDGGGRDSVISKARTPPLRSSPTNLCVTTPQLLKGGCYCATVRVPLSYERVSECPLEARCCHLFPIC